MRSFSRLRLAAIGLTSLLGLAVTEVSAAETIAAPVYPWGAIGRVNLAGMGHCSGALIAPNLVLTAAHCLYNARASRFIAAEYLRFVAGYERDSYLAAAAVIDYRLPAAFDPKKVETLANLSNDWAILVLDQPIGNQVGYIGVYNLDRAELAQLRGNGVKFARAGYAHDLAHVITVDFGCAVRGFINEMPLIAHESPTQPGDSGGPLLALLKDGPVVVGVHNGRVEANEGRFGTAVPAHSFYRTIAVAKPSDATIGTAAQGYAGRAPLSGKAPAPTSISGAPQAAAATP